MKLEWQDAPTQTQWGHDMVVATVALGKDHSVDLYCARSKTAEAEALLKKPWVDLPDEEIGELIIGTLSADTNPAQTRPRDIKFARSVLATFKEKNT